MTLYLILHKVRGEPALDIAQRVQIGEEDGWIIPTSGHRAYPVSIWPVHEPVTDHLREYATEPQWTDTPDHYQTSASPRKVKIEIDFGELFDEPQVIIKPRKFT